MNPYSELFGIKLIWLYSSHVIEPSLQRSSYFFLLFLEKSCFDVRWVLLTIYFTLVLYTLSIALWHIVTWILIKRYWNSRIKVQITVILHQFINIKHTRSIILSVYLLILTVLLTACRIFHDVRILIMKVYIYSVSYSGEKWIMKANVALFSHFQTTEHKKSISISHMHTIFLASCFVYGRKYRPKLIRFYVAW